MMNASSEAGTTRRVLRPLLVSPYGRIGGAQLLLLGIVDAGRPDLEPRGLVMADGPFADMLRARGVPTDIVSLPGKQAVRSFSSAARAVAERLRTVRTSHSCTPTGSRPRASGSRLRGGWGCRSSG